MSKYYVNPDSSSNPNNNNEVHKEGCDWMPKEAIYLGEFSNCRQAVAKAKQAGYPDADGCAHCCPEAHTE